MSIEAMKQALEALAYLQGIVDTERGPKAMKALRQAIDQAEKQEPVAWKNAAIRLGEELSSVGPDGYYDMTAEQWLGWAMNQQPRGNNSLPQPQREWVGLTDEEIMEMLEYGQYGRVPQYARNFVDAIEAKLKEKNA
jgi:hypothetical protein